VADEPVANNAFKNRCANAALTLRSCGSYFVDRITLDESNEDNKDNALDVWLREGPWKPDVVISLSSLYSVRPWESGLGASPVFGISLIHLPKMPLPWPGEAVGRLDRSEDLPELVWLRIFGPVEVDAVAL
jgi:hypothetical protein